MIICTTRSIGSASVSGSVRESMITGPDIKVQPISRQTKKSRTSATPSTVAVAVAPNPCSLLSARLRRCVGRHLHGAIFIGVIHSGKQPPVLMPGMRLHGHTEGQRPGLGSSAVLLDFRVAALIVIGADQPPLVHDLQRAEFGINIADALGAAFLIGRRNGSANGSFALCHPCLAGALARADNHPSDGSIDHVPAR